MAHHYICLARASMFIVPEPMRPPHLLGSISSRIPDWERRVMTPTTLTLAQCCHTTDTTFAYYRCSSCTPRVMMRITCDAWGHGLQSPSIHGASLKFFFVTLSLSLCHSHFHNRDMVTVTTGVSGTRGLRGCVAVSVFMRT